MTSFQEKLKNFKPGYKHVLGLGFGVLGFSYLLVLLIDVLNIFGLRGLPGGIIPFYWNTLFAERGLIELTQWTMLTGLIIVSYKLKEYFKEKEDLIEHKFWLLIMVTGVLMLFEDALNPRHLVFRYILDLHWQHINIAETIYFGLLASIPLYALLRYGNAIKQHRKTLSLLLAGGFFYGLAVTISGPGHSFGVTILGEKALEATTMLGGEELKTAYEISEQKIIEVHGNDYDDLAFMFTDHFIEESLELIGATLLTASATLYHQTQKN